MQLFGANYIPFFPTQESLLECKGMTAEICFYEYFLKISNLQA